MNHKRDSSRCVLSDVVQLKCSLLGGATSSLSFIRRSGCNNQVRMAGIYPPFLNTQEGRGAVVTVISFTFVAVSTLTNCIRVVVRQQSERALGLDDALLVSSNVSKSTWA
jgi:hypothetical protein